MSKFTERLNDPVIEAQDQKLKNDNGIYSDHISSVISSQTMPRWRFIMIMITLSLIPFTYSLDILILATSMPAIVDSFGALDRVAWLANAFFLTMFGFNLAYAQWLQLFPAKHVGLFALFIFEVGAAVSGSASSMNILFAGRALSGLGAAGLYNVSVNIVTELCAVKLRVKVFGLLSASFALASIVGPALSGMLTDKLSWRYCFYVNIPFGIITMILLVVFVEQRPPCGFAGTYSGYNKHLLVRFLRCDWIGVLFCIAWGAALIVTMELGGTVLPWSHPVIVVLLILMVVIPPVFYLWERRLGTRAMLQVETLRTRTMIASCIVGTFVFANSITILCWLAEMYRAVYNFSGVKSSVYLLPYVFGNLFALLFTAIYISKTRMGFPLLILGGICAMVPSAILSTMGVNTATGQPPSVALPIVLSFFVSFAIGLVSQTTLNVAQNEFHDSAALLVHASGTAIFANTIGRVVGLWREHKAKDEMK